MIKKLLIITGISVLVGCSVNVSPNHIAWGEEVCSNNDGLKYLQVWDDLYPNARCNDGALFTGTRGNFNRELKDD